MAFTITFDLEEADKPLAQSGGTSTPEQSEGAKPFTVEIPKGDDGSEQSAPPKPVYESRKGEISEEGRRNPSLQGSFTGDIGEEIAKAIPRPVQAGLEGRKMGRETAATWESSGIPEKVASINPIYNLLRHLPGQAGQDVRLAREASQSAIMELFSGLGNAMGDVTKPVMVGLRYPFAAAKAVSQFLGGDLHGARMTLENPAQQMVDFHPTQTESATVNLVGDVAKAAVNNPEIVAALGLTTGRSGVAEDLPGRTVPRTMKPYRQFPPREARAPSLESRPETIFQEEPTPSREAARGQADISSEVSKASQAQEPTEDINAALQSEYEKELPAKQGEEAYNMESEGREEAFEKTLRDVPKESVKYSKEDLRDMSRGEVAKKISKTPVHRLPPEIGKSIQEEAGYMQREAAEGEPGRRIHFTKYDSAGEFEHPEVAGVPSTYPEWYSKLRRAKEDINDALEKIIKDKGSDKGALVEKLKVEIAKRKFAGYQDRNVGNIPPDSAFQELGKGQEPESGLYDDDLREAAKKPRKPKKVKASEIKKPAKDYSDWKPTLPESPKSEPGISGTEAMGYGSKPNEIAPSKESVAMERPVEETPAAEEAPKKPKRYSIRKKKKAVSKKKKPKAESESDEASE